MLDKLKREIDSFFERDPAAKSRMEIIICYPGFHAVLLHRVAHKLWIRNWRLLARFLSQVSRFFTGIEIHPGAEIGARFFIDHGMGVVIGETARIGNDVTLYHDVTLGGVSFSPGIRHPQIGNNVIIGAGAQLLGPIIVGDNARIGSNAVVVKDVPQGATMVGVPAREVKPKLRSLKASEDHHFDAYATIGELTDPVQKSLEHLTKEVTKLKKRIEELEGGAVDTARKWEAKP